MVNDGEFFVYVLFSLGDFLIDNLCVVSVVGQYLGLVRLLLICV